jgi:hypothetical protein
MTQHAYIATCQIWVSDTETIPIPVLGVFDSPKAAQDNAYAVLMRQLTADAPHLLDKRVTVVAAPLPDAAVRGFLATLEQRRPDLLKPEKVQRGKVR